MNEWKPARAFVSPDEAEEELNRLRPLRDGFELRVTVGSDPRYPHELQYRRQRERTQRR